jgi:hypothetical protein
MNDRNSIIIRLWNDDKSASQIATQLAITKNIVIGVITRERDSGSGLITRDKLPGPYDCGSRGGKRTHKKRPGAQQVKVHTMPKLFRVESKPEKRQTKIIGVSLVELENNSCRFPTSRVADQHYFCGSPKRDRDTSYCAEHHSIAFVKKRKLTSEELRTLKQGYAMKQWLKGSEAAQRI